MRMEFEMLIRRVFGHCGRWGDPLRLANADTYDHNVGNQGHRLIFGISYALKKAIADTDESQFANEVHQLEQLDMDIWNANNQQEVNRIIDDAHNILDAIGTY